MRAKEPTERRNVEVITITNLTLNRQLLSVQCRYQGGATHAKRLVIDTGVGINFVMFKEIILNSHPG